MSRKMIQMALAMASMCQYAAKEELFSARPRSQTETREVKPRMVHEAHPKQLHEFVVKGKKIMATSRKDAIKRYNQKYK